MQEHKIVEVEWFDAQSSTDTFSLEELIEIGILKTKSCGYLLYQNKEMIILGFMMFGNELIKHHQIIPMGMVKKINVLKCVNHKEQGK